MSKIISLPRYACSFNGINKNSLDKADIMVANFVRKAIGLDYTLSKSVIFNCKQIGGLGITRPSTQLQQHLHLTPTHPLDTLSSDS